MPARRNVFGGALCALIILSASGLAARDEPLAGWFDLAVPGGEPTLVALGMTLDERAFTLPMLARTLQDRDQHARLASTLAQLITAADSSTGAITVPAPLDASLWRDILPPVRKSASTDLFARIVSDRNALLLASGLMATSDGVRAFLARDRNLLRFIHQDAAASFALVARRLEIVDGRLVLPGGPGADAAWQSLAGVSPSGPGAFIRALLTSDDGRLAWYYDAIGSLNTEQVAAAWPQTGPPAQRAALLYPAFREPDPQWRVADQPFRRASIDAWMVVTQNSVNDGKVSSPLPQASWDLLFSNERVTEEQVTRSLRGGGPGVLLPWLARETLSPLVRERRNRYEMFRLAQRVFADAPRSALPQVGVALSGLRQHRALMFTLERMGIRDAATWVAAVRAARYVGEQADDRRTSHVIFQASVALLERIRHSRALDAAASAALVRSLSSAVIADKRVPQSIAAWIATVLVPALPPVDSEIFETSKAAETAIARALAGPLERERPTIEWEGLTYTVDPVAAEFERLRAMHALLPGPQLDAAIASLRARDLADALTALVYATALGDAEGPASLSPDVATRHEFGLSATALVREELPWAPPEERQGAGPWHVQGSLLGLDLGLSRLALRRIADQQMPPEPTLTLNDLGTLTRTAVALVPLDLDVAGRDEIAASIVRGRERVRTARTIADLTALANECGMSAYTRQLLPWLAARQQEAVEGVFSLRDLMWLGNPALSRDRLDRWGVAADSLDGRRILSMPGPFPWEDYAGRSEAGQLTTQVPDLTLRLIEETARLKLPGTLIPALLAFALEDYWHEVRARFADDWPRLTRQAASLSSMRIHDYVAALTGGGPLRTQ